jgi:predicted esterase
VKRSRLSFLLRLASLFSSASLAACAHADVPSKDDAHPIIAAAIPAEAPAVATATASASEEKLPPLEAPWIERMELPNGEIVWVAAPVGARDKRAIVVGVHGAGDHADWACSEWHAVVANWAFVVCPQGIRHPTDKTAFVWGSSEAIAAQADRAVAAVRAKYTQYVADGPLVYGGWSQGATLASEVIRSRPNVYDRAVLVEVGHTPLDASAVVNSFVTSGIRRAVVSCSSSKCRTFAQSFDAAAKRRGLKTERNDVGLRGHWFDEPVFRSLGPKVAWMVSDDPRYTGLAAAVDARWQTD